MKTTRFIDFLIFRYVTIRTCLKLLIPKRYNIFPKKNRIFVEKSLYMRKKELYDKVIAYFEQAMPVAETELHYGNPFELLIAVILSAQ